MKKILILLSCALLLPALPAVAQTSTQWTLVQSTLTYHITHPIHHVSGISHAAKGKGICQAGRCNFLIAAPVKSFQTGDSNRDLHMLEATRGAQFPMVIVRAQFPSSEIDSPTLYADIQVQFSGQTAQYKHVAFQRTTQDGNVEIKGTIPATCSDFKIQRPSFLTVPISNEIPITVDMTWRK
ncbi:MAG: YceI family protein [Acidobacteriaceae bacterium]